MTTRQYTYDLDRLPSGAPHLCLSAERGPYYYKVVAIRVDGRPVERSPRHTLARCRTVADALAIVDALNRYSIA